MENGANSIINVQKRSHSEQVPSLSTHQTASSGSTSASDKEMTLQQINIIPRAFEPWPVGLPLPCAPLDANNLSHRAVAKAKNVPTDNGFLFVKTTKTASSTCSGVNLRIAKKEAARQNKNYSPPFCNARFDHLGVDDLSRVYGNRDLTKSVLWAIIRDPTKRHISEFWHFAVSRHGQPWSGKKPNLENFKDYFFKSTYGSKRRSKYYINHLPVHPYIGGGEADTALVANQILRDYNFIGTVERLNESLVALAMILHIPLSDVLYLSAKLNGGYDNLCNFIIPSNVTSDMREYLNSAEWFDAIKDDLAFHRAVNASLDLTINVLGREEFALNLERFERGLGLARDQCHAQATFSCMNGRQMGKNDCLWKDSGCGDACLDTVVF
eukprot:scaffold13866_cov175-Amphora_coffeaeformis.AAC.3